MKYLLITMLLGALYSQDCPENMYYDTCGQSFGCNPSCSNPDGSENCDMSCNFGCFCNIGYVFSDINYDTCILLEDCDECDENILCGCTDLEAPNYDEEAIIDDGSCEEYGIPLSEGDNFIVITDYINDDYSFSSIVDHDWFVGEGYLLVIVGNGVAAIYDNGVWTGSLEYLALNTLYDFVMSDAAIYTYPFAVYPDCMGDYLICFGDINGDYTINVIDVVMTVNLILNGNYDMVGDVNQDGQVNVIDIVMLVDMILNP